MKVNKTTITKVIKCSRNLDSAAKTLGISRRELFRLREQLGIMHIPANSSTEKLVFELEVVEANSEKDNSLVEEYSVDELSDINKVLDSFPNADNYNNVVCKENVLTKDLCEQLGISEKELAKLKAKKDKEVEEEKVNPNLHTKFDGRFKEQTDTTHNNIDKFVITSVQNDTLIDKKFLQSLKTYCNLNQAKLLIVPVYYSFKDGSKFNVPEEDMFFDNVQLNNNLKLLAKLKISPTIVDPFAGIDSLSKGDSIIVPHPQVAMKTMPTLSGQAAQMYTTGSLSLKQGAYGKNKTGYKAEFNHSNAALIVELGSGDSFHVRGLNCDNEHGFYDISGYYNGDTFEPLEYVEAIYLGDTHAGVIDPNVVNATYKNKDSMFKKLKPKYAIHGDILDFSSQSHHDSHDYFTRVAKHKFGKNDVRAELTGVATFLRSSHVPGVQNLIVGSNHNEHLFKWLTTTDTKNDLVNASVYHQLSYFMIEEMESIPSGVSFPNVLELWFRRTENKDILKYTDFLNRTDGYKIKDIEISMHGDKGPNGSRGSPNAFGRLPTKSIVGHSHSPSIRLGCYTVGTSSMLNLSYNSGASSWMQSHCVIYPNGKRQMINIINGKWNNS